MIRREQPLLIFDHQGYVLDGRLGEKLGEGQAIAEPFQGQRDDACHEQRMATEFKKVVVNADGTPMEHFLPNLDEMSLHAVLRRGYVPAVARFPWWAGVGHGGRVCRWR